MASSFEIATPRLRLYAPTSAEVQALRRGDRTELAAHINAAVPEAWWFGPSLLRLLPDLPEAMAHEPNDARWIWLVIDPISAQIIGDIGYHGPLHDDATVEIGYSLMPHAHGFGYATEAISALIQWTFAHTQVAQIIAQIKPENAASLRVAARLGMQSMLPLSTEYLCFGISRPSM